MQYSFVHRLKASLIINKQSFNYNSAGFQRIAAVAEALNIKIQETNV